MEWFAKHANISYTRKKVCGDNHKGFIDDFEIWSENLFNPNEIYSIHFGPLCWKLD